MFMFLISVLSVYIFTLQRDKTYNDHQQSLKLKELESALNEARNRKKISPKAVVVTATTAATGTDLIQSRDDAVINDDLYPPLNRMARPLADEYLRYKMDGTFGQYTRGAPDTYRLVGYLINSTDRNDKWNIYGRQKYRGSNQGDYYAVQQCGGHGPCTKIILSDDIVVGNTLRDYYNLPSTITFNSPALLTTPYDVVQLKTNIDYSPYY